MLNIIMRNEYLDFVKGIAIFLVVWGHVIQGAFCMQYSGVNPNLDGIYKLIYTVHMPLFMGICGYFFSVSLSRYGVKKYIQEKFLKRVMGLVWPMLFFGGVLHFMLSDNYNILSWLILSHNGVWFLGCLVVNTSLVLIALLFHEHFRLNYGLLLFCMWLLSAIPAPIFYGGNGFFMYFFFVVGFEIYKSEKIGKIIKYKYMIIALYIGLYLLFCSIPYEPVSFNINIFKFGDDKVWDVFIVDVLRVFMGICGGGSVLLVLWEVYKKYHLRKFPKWFSNVGKYTLQIYLLQIVILEQLLTQLYYFFAHRYEYNPLICNGVFFEVVATSFVAICVLVFIVYVVRIINKSPFVKTLLFYK